MSATEGQLIDLQASIDSVISYYQTMRDALGDNWEYSGEQATEDLEYLETTGIMSLLCDIAAGDDY